MTEIDESKFSTEVGQRLRAVRRQRGWSLDDVERESGGRWSASAIGAYERGYRNLSLPRLQELAAFFGVQMSVLLGEVDTGPSRRSDRVVLDLVALEREEAAKAVARFAGEIRAERGDSDAVVLSIRKDDLRALCSVVDMTEAELIEKMENWGVLANRVTADA